jgi:capsular polysaccharide biosynthesis protein
MKKNNPYITDDEIDLGDLIRILWREKILILSISIVCSLISYYYLSFRVIQEFKTEILLKDPPLQIFDSYDSALEKNNLLTQYVLEFKLTFLSSDNLETFLKESLEYDNFKKYLESKNITVKQYFYNKVKEEKEKNSYSFFFTKELDGDIFIRKYIEFTKKKTTIQFKETLKTRIENKITSFEESLETAKKLNSKNEILNLIDSNKLNENELESLFLRSNLELSKSIIIFKQNIINLNKLLQKLEVDQLNFNIILDGPSIPVLKNPKSAKLFFLPGLFSGLLISLVIIFNKIYIKKQIINLK